MSGVYMQVSVMPKHANILSNIVWCMLDGKTVSTPDKFLKPEDYHATILYSKNRGEVEDIEPKPGKQYTAVIKDIEQWDENDVCLVCTLESRALQLRHKDLMAEHDLHWSYPEYKPHVTLCYDITLTPKLLERLKDKLVGRSIILGNETVEALDEEYSHTDS
jgi:2'-5' RNA ligase